MKEAERLGWLLSELCEGGVLRLCLGGWRGLCEGRSTRGVLSHTCSEPGHLGTLQAKATSAPQKLSKLGFGCSRSCCHGDTEGSSESIGDTGLPSAWFEAGGGGGHIVGQQRDLLGPCQAQHPQTYATWQPLALEFTELGLNPNC